MDLLAGSSLDKRLSWVYEVLIVFCLLLQLLDSIMITILVDIR
jgi:hypothetical protein